MRQDMKKVLTERPRHGHGRKYHDVRRAANRGDLEDLPHCQGMRAAYDSYTDRKEFSDLLGPLQRFLQGCVGRKYNDVWSEICKAVPSGNVVDEHLKGHARSEVEYDTFIHEGEVFCKPGPASRRFRRNSGFSKPDGLYVDPRDGVIYDATKRVSKKKQSEGVLRNALGSFKQDETGVYKHHTPYGYYYGRPNARDWDLAFFGKEEEAVKMGGIWYWTVFDTVPPPIVRHYTDESGEKKTVTNIIYKTDIIYGSGMKSGQRYRCAKVQINSRDLKQHGLVND